MREQPTMPEMSALQEMARRTALTLVARELQALAGGEIVTVTAIETPPQTRRLALPPKPSTRRGRKPGPKPGAPGRKWTAARRAKFSATMAARRGVAVPTAKRGPGRPRKTPAADVGVDRCVACDHTRAEHELNNGKCLSYRCACRGFAAR